MKKNFLKFCCAVVFFAATSPALAAGPQPNILYQLSPEEMTASAYIVVDKASGQVLLQHQSELAWTPASLTKLVTAMVVLDANPKLEGKMAMKKTDEVGGARLATKAGVQYKVKDLFFATLVASTNNGANAISRSLGISQEEFVARMNEKARFLGALNTKFVEPSGIDPANATTAADFAKIAAAAFSYPEITKAANTARYVFSSVGGGKKYSHSLKTTNKLLADGGFLIGGAKTGYLVESRYNFTAELKDVDGKNIIVVLFGSRSPTTEFFETKKLAVWTWSNYVWNKDGQVAGASTGLQMP